MKHTIRHGSVIDVPSTQEMQDTIAQQFAKGIDQRRDSGYRREKQAIILDGTGGGIITLRATRMYDWICQRVTCAAGAAGQVTFYENQVQDSDIMEVIQLNAQFRYSDSFANTLFVPAGSQFLAVFAGCGANAQASLNLQIHLIKTSN